MLRKHKTGFTIIELVVSISVIAILSTIIAVSYFGWRERIAETEIKNDLIGAATALEQSLVFGDTYPEAIPSTFKSNGGVALTYRRGADGLSFCIDALSSTNPSIQFHITNEDNEVKAGVCEDGPTTPNPTIPVITVALNTTNAEATLVTPSTCSEGTAEYGTRIRINDGTWGSYTDWSATFNKASQVADDGIKYGYQTQSRCYVDATHISGTVASIEATYIDPIDSVPSVPVVTATTAGDTTTWSWPTVSCPIGNTNYQYQYTIAPSGYNSGWVNNNTTTQVAFMTTADGETYTVAVQARCANNNATGNWSASASDSYLRIYPPVVGSPVVASITTTTATLGATVQTGVSLTARGTCWGTTANPTTNCSTLSGILGSFNDARTGLPSNSLIYFRGYATNSGGTGYSADASFNTDPPVILPSTVPNAYITATGTAPTTTAVGNIDNGVATPDATYFVAGANSAGTAFYDLADMPTGFVGMITTNYNISYKITPLAGDVETLSVQIFKSDRTTPLTDKMLVQSATAVVAEVTKGITAFTGVNTTATKADWDGAVLAIITTHKATGFKDNSKWSINEVEIGGTYGN